MNRDDDKAGIWAETSDGKLLPLEDIVENQKAQLAKFAEELEQLQRENRQLKEELRIARSDRQDAETAIASYFIEHWRSGK